MEEKAQIRVFPKQCQETGEAFVKAHGLERSKKIVKNYIKSLDMSIEFLDKNFKMTKLTLAIQSDFWNQTLNYIKTKS